MKNGSSECFRFFMPINNDFVYKYPKVDRKTLYFSRILRELIPFVCKKRSFLES